MMSSDDEPMYCATCRRGLVRVSTSSGGVVGYRHHMTRTEPHAGHDPAPVPLMTLAGEAMMRCDFCAAEGHPGADSGPQWLYLAAEVTTHDRHIVAETVGIGDYRNRHHAARRLSVKTEDGIGRRWGERWAACADCAALIESRSVLRLVARVVESMPASVVRGRKLLRVRGKLIDWYEHLFATLTPGRGRITADHPIGGEWENTEP